MKWLWGSLAFAIIVALVMVNGAMWDRIEKERDMCVERSL